MRASVQTSPIPPLPISDITSYAPSRVPLLSAIQSADLRICESINAARKRGKHRECTYNGMISTMITTMDAAGRLVIPREVRREAGLRPGVPLDVRWRNGLIEIEPEPLPVTVARKGRLTVAIPGRPIEPLRAEAVEDTRRGLRRERRPSR